MITDQSRVDVARRKAMQQPIFTTVLGYLLVALSATGYTASASANAAGDCRQEATDYGISPELVDEYVEGCLASRGELIEDEAVQVEYEPPAEPMYEEDQQQYEEDLQEALPVDDDDAAQ
jgi:hypothetical protein